MPFMIGSNPIIRTKRYLDIGKVYLKDRIKVFTVHYNTILDPTHGGAREFAIWHLPQIQYKNPGVQCTVIRNLTPTPLIRCFLADGTDIVVDLFNKKKSEILDHVINVLGKPPHVIEEELMAKEKKENPANFGFKCKNHCICDIFGQVPCPAVVPVPKHIRGKVKSQSGKKYQTYNGFVTY